MTFFKLWSVRAGLAYIVLWALFLIPYTGIFLMFGMAMAGPYLWGLIPHLIILGLIIDIQTKKVSQLLWTIPILLYGSYYVFYAFQEIEIKSVERELKSINPDVIIKFDPDKHSLVSNDSGNIGKYNKISVSYEENSNFPEGFLSYRIASQNLCKKAHGLGIENLNTFGFSWMEFRGIHGRNYYFQPDACQIRSSEIPDKNIIKVVRTDDDRYSKENKNKLIYKTTYDFYLNNEKLKTFTAGSVNHLPLFPFTWGGCGLNSSAASWDCFLNFYRQNNQLDVWPKSVNVDLYNANPVAAMLHIEKYEEKDLSNFFDYPDTEQYINNIFEKKKRETSVDLNRWGIRKDSLYMPKIGKTGGVDSFQGVVYHGDKGGEFYDFIKQHEGSVVYLDIDAKPNARFDSFRNYGVCKARENCTSRTDDSYQFFAQNGSRKKFPVEGKFKGVFLVGKESAVIDRENPNDNDTITKLIFLRSEP